MLIGQKHLLHSTLLQSLREKMLLSNANKSTQGTKENEETGNWIPNKIERQIFKSYLEWQMTYLGLQKSK